MTEGQEQKFVITKRYAHKITQNFQSWDFSSELSVEVTVKSSTELIEANDKLFAQVKWLCEKDIETVFHSEDQGV
jgi:hypothetical protein